MVAVSFFYCRSHQKTMARSMVAVSFLFCRSHQTTMAVTGFSISLPSGRSRSIWIHCCKVSCVFSTRLSAHCLHSVLYISLHSNTYCFLCVMGLKFEFLWYWKVYIDRQSPGVWHTLLKDRQSPGAWHTLFKLLLRIFNAGHESPDTCSC